VKLLYEIVPVDTAKGEQHTPAFRAINPNGKVPVIVDNAGPGGVEARVFDSTATLLYLGEKTGELMGSPADREELLSWFLFMASGLGPFSGQAVHFQRAAPEKTAVRGQPLPTRGRTPLCCPRQAPRVPRVHWRRRVYDPPIFRLGAGSRPALAANPNGGIACVFGNHAASPI
jgi:glutathione S-transferase